MTKEGKEKKSKKDKSTPKKAKTEAANGVEHEVATPAEVAPAVQRMLIPIASPLADDKLCKKVLKVAKKAAKRKLIKRGVKEVVKALRKGVKGICIIAGDISPIDVITHLPVFCETKDIPYIYVPSKEELGAAGLTKRPTSCMLVLPKSLKAGVVEDDEAKEFHTSYIELEKKVRSVQIFV